MLALSIEPAQILIGIGVGIVAFILAWFLLGTAARQKQDRDREARMRAVIQPGQQSGQAAVVSASSGGGIPDNVSKFGTRFAGSRGFSERAPPPIPGPPRPPPAGGVVGGFPGALPLFRG